MLLLAQLLYVALMPFLLVGVVQRTKAWWGGRRGPGLLQSAHDTARLLRKRAIQSDSGSAVFRVGAPAVFATTLLASLLAPLFPGYAPVSFAYDFLALGYLLALGRVALMLSALDTASAFEGMGASREALLSVLAEPALFLVLGALVLGSGHATLAEASTFRGGIAGTAPAILALLLLLQIEAARVPVDDPATHLELTMIHEVMVLDHSGPELAFVQLGAALKLALFAGLIAALANPFSTSTAPLASVLASFAIALVVAVVVGCVESLFARLRMRHLPAYAGIAVLLALSMLASVSGGSS